MRTLLASAIVLGLFALLPSGASALFSQCPPIGADTGCQFLITLTNGTPTIQQDTAQPAYELSEDALVGVQNNSSSAIAALPLSGPGIFGFDADGICNPNSGTTGAVPPGCVPAPGAPAGTVCGLQFGSCSFPKPPVSPPATESRARPPLTRRTATRVPACGSPP